MNRRNFLLQTSVAGSLLTSAARAAHSDSSSSKSSRSLRVLLLGGTGYIGTHFAYAATARGHQVAVFSRGTKDPNLPATVQHLIGDRDGNLKSIRDRDWDAVFDLATYGPGWVRSIGQALKGRVRHYTFISSIMAYQYPGATDEQSKLQKYTGTDDPYTVSAPGPDYGALKVLSEQEALRQFPGKVVVIRPGTIVGPGERVGALTYWAARMQRGGEILAAGNPLSLVQFIDVRDLAEWAIRLAESHTTGTFTAVGPTKPLGWAEMLGGLRATFAVPTTLTWVPSEWLINRRLHSFNPLLFWPEQAGLPGSTELKNEKACANGLIFRPFHTTVVDTLDWHKGLPIEKQRTAILPFDQRSTTLEDAMAREAELLLDWHRNDASIRYSCKEARAQ